MAAKISIYCISFIFLILFNINEAFCVNNDLKITSSSAILVDAVRGQVLYNKQSDKKVNISLASKIMTALIAIENAKLDSKITISKISANKEGSDIKLEAGEKYSLLDLLSALILNSSSDAANAIAEYIEGDIKSFVEKMNAKANELNMKNTKFKNVTGISEQLQYTTCYDLSILIKTALQNSDFNSIFSSKAKTWNDQNGTQILVNLNKLFWSLDGVDGGMASSVENGKKTAITTLTKDKQRLIAMSIDSNENDIFNDLTKLLEYGFKNFKMGELVKKDQVLKTIDIEGEKVKLVANSDVIYTFPIEDNYIKSVQFNINKNNKLPVLKENIMGYAKYILKDNSSIEVALFPQKDILYSHDLVAVFLNKVMQYKELFGLLLLLIIIEAFLIVSSVVRLVKVKILRKF